MKNIIITIHLFLFLIPLFATAQINPKSNVTLQADITTLLVIGNIGASADFDIFEIDSTNIVGTRIGVSSTFGFNPEGSNNNSYTDFDGLTRLTLNGKYVDFNLCPGLTYHSASSDYKSGVYLKLNSDLKIKLAENYFGLLAKLSLSKELFLGVGIYLGYSSRN